MKNIIRPSVIVLISLLVQPVWAVCNSAMHKSKPDIIYTDNNDGTISDLKTGLMWQKCSMGLSGNQCDQGSVTLLSWKNALFESVELNTVGFANYNDWRLPSVAELRTLLEDACNKPAINNQFFPGTVYNNNHAYWSSSAYAGDPNGDPQNYVNQAQNAWVVSFDLGAESFDLKSKAMPVRLVRDQ